MKTEVDSDDSAQVIRILNAPDPDLAQKRSKPMALTGSADTGHPFAGFYFEKNA